MQVMITGIFLSKIFREMANFAETETTIAASKQPIDQ